MLPGILYTRNPDKIKRYIVGQTSAIINITLIQIISKYPWSYRERHIPPHPSCTAAFNELNEVVLSDGGRYVPAPVHGEIGRPGHC